MHSAFTVVEICNAVDSCYYPLPANQTAGQCGQGNIPEYSVHALSIDHVQKYVKFAVKNNLRSMLPISFSASIPANLRSFSLVVIKKIPVMTSRDAVLIKEASPSG